MKPEKQLYQWDVNQYLTELQPTAEFLDYPMGNEVIRIKADGTRCRIPDEVLQTYGGKTCYERYPDGTYRAYSFNVLYAPKPPDYIYTAEERTTFDALVAKADAAIAEIKRRADSGEFTPVKGVDYFTDAEKNEMMESVSTGAIGEFRKVVDTATTEYDTNAEQQTTDYNRNAAEKLEAYNSNHAEKVAEYNANAETKTAEFDSNAAALQTEVDRLRGECDNLAAENRKQENRISALMKLNKGQTYDILKEEGESASRTAPSGAKYVSVDKVGGKSVVWNQFVLNTNKNYINGETTDTKTRLQLKIQNGVSPVVNVYNTTILATGKVEKVIKVTQDGGSGLIIKHNGAIKDLIMYANYYQSMYKNHVYLFAADFAGINPTAVNGLSVNNIQFFDLTQMFGSTIADYIYSLEQATTGAGVAWFKKLFPADYYPYSEPTIISSQTDRVDVASADGTITQQIPTNFPVLNSAGSVYDYIDLNEGKLHQRVGVVDLGTFNWGMFAYGESTVFRSYDYTGKKPSGSTHVANTICSDYVSVSADGLYSFDTDKAIAVHNGGVGLIVNDSTYTDATAFKEAMKGVMLYYELAEEVITDIDIPTELTDWLTVEAGGSVTYHNSDDSKQLAVPNAVSWVRKLNEVE